MGKRRLRTACAFNANLQMVTYFLVSRVPCRISHLAKDGTKRRNRMGRAVQAVSPLVRHSLSNRIDQSFLRSVGCVSDSVKVIIIRRETTGSLAVD